MITPQDFFNEWNNRPCNPDGAYGNQCVDVVDQYGKEIGRPLPAVNGAKDFWDRNLLGYTKIVNTPTNVPDTGSILVWGVGIGSSFGHTAIFVSGTTNEFDSFDQDFPTQGYIDDKGNFIGTGVCHFQHHNNYNGLLGWFTPDSSAIIPQPIAQPPTTASGWTDQIKVPAALLGTDTDQEVQQIRGVYGDVKRLSSVNDNALSANNQQAIIIAQLNKERSDLMDQVKLLTLSQDTLRDTLKKTQNDLTLAQQAIGLPLTNQQLIGLVWRRFFSRLGQ